MMHERASKVNGCEMARQNHKTTTMNDVDGDDYAYVMRRRIRMAERCNVPPMRAERNGFLLRRRLSPINGVLHDDLWVMS